MKEEEGQISANNNGMNITPRKIVRNTALMSSYSYTFPDKSGTFALTSDLTWGSITGKPSWIGSSKPSYSWTEITGKPSWIGSSKPSYSWTEITGKPTFANVATSGSYNDLTDKPTAIKNPYSLSITANGTTVTYDGSASRSITIPSGGSGGSGGTAIGISYDNINIYGDEIFNLQRPTKTNQKYLYFINITGDLEQNSASQMKIIIEGDYSRVTITPKYSLNAFNNGLIQTSFLLMIERTGLSAFRTVFEGEPVATWSGESSPSVECSFVGGGSTQSMNISWTLLEIG